MPEDTIRCARCGCGRSALIHHATANGHEFTTERVNVKVGGHDA